MAYNSSMEKKGLTREQLKLLAIAAMVSDHVAWGFVDFMSPLGQVMHIFGRLTLPIMCFFIAEGYRHTRDIRQYLSRMVSFSLIAIIPFYIFFHEEYAYRQNIIFDLTLALLSIVISEHKAFPRVIRILLNLLLFIVSALIGGWVIMPILYTRIFYYGKSFRHKAFLFCVVTCLMQAWLLPAIILNQRYAFMPQYADWTVGERLYLFGFMLALIPLYFYNGEKGRTFGGRYFFYIFYPAHFLVLSAIRYLILGPGPQMIYIYAHVIALFIGISILIYVIIQPVSRAQMAVTFFMTVGIMYIFGFLLEITTMEAEGVYTATKLQYFAECLVMIAITFCMQELCHSRVPRPVYVAQCVVSVGFMYCMFTYNISSSY